MTRLAIIDVTGGQQPILNERKNVAIVCNGEIYNYRQLRARLERNGHVFRTQSDVEVVLHLYEDEGTNCFRRLNGMFAVAIADFERHRLVLARDHCGQKPLYLWRGPGCVSFASELKAMAQLPGFPRAISGEALTSFLALHYIPAPLTIFEAADKLPPGTWLSVDEAGKTESGRYWQMDLCRNGSGERANKSAIRDQLTAAVERHLMSERPLGVFLSGGLDSASIVACMHRAGHRDIRTFTVGFEGYLDNEFQNASRVARHFGTTHEEIILTPEHCWNSLEDMVFSEDEPMADMTCIPLYHLAARASRDVVVVLSGEGSDELLAGYNGTDKLLRTFDLLHAVRRLAPLAKLLLRCKPPDFVRRRLAAVGGTDADYLLRQVRSSAAGTFDSRFRRMHGSELANCGDAHELMADYCDRHQDWDGMHLMLGLMMEWWLPDDLLHKADRMTMAHSLELRCPFLDTEFVDYCARLPMEAKVAARKVEPTRKIALKEAFQDALPEGIAYQAKKGFVIPAFQWLRDFYTERARSELARPGSLAAQLFPLSLRMKLVDRAAEGHLPTQRDVWSLIVLNKWADRWL